jgi:hypothetical protein
VADLFGDADACHEAIVDAFKSELSRAEDSWKALEGKAQGTIAVAGIFAGFALNFAKDLPASATQPARILTIAAIVVLALSIAWAAASLLVRTIGEPPGGALHAELAGHLTSVRSFERSEYRTGLRENLVQAWRSAVEDRSRVNKTKAHLVRVSQAFLLAAISVAALLAIYVSLVPQKAPTPPTPAPVTYEVHH